MGYHGEQLFYFKISLGHQNITKQYIDTLAQRNNQQVPKKEKN